MIKLSKINKFFNTGKLNEIHVINDTSLVFPEIGLVALTGPSGCGKTTLLNVIGGLDKFDSGTIDFDGKIIKSYNPTEWDILRNLYVGYIFQNYNLITDKTVYENVEIALNMAGLYDKEMVEERINYVLRSVGMYNYRKRNVQALSGGQQQRVAIARAIAKNPKVVLADEPTGNLDANNTFEIMSIIKKISQNCLVILVSHEKEIVDFYADRVIELADGLISKDYENVGNRTLEHIDDRNIYLKDLEEESGDAPLPVQFYYQKKLESLPSVQVIHFNNTVFVKVDSKTKVKYITSDSEIKLIDEHYKKPETEDASRYLFDLEQFGIIKTDERRKSFIRFWDALKAGFLKVFGKRKFFGKLFLLAYFVISGLIVYNLATFANLTKVDEKEFLTMSKDLVSVEVTEAMVMQDIKDIIANTSAISAMSYSDSIGAVLIYKDLYQGSGERNWGVELRAYPVKKSLVADGVVTFGRLPNDKTEVAIDEWVADLILENKSISDLGVTSYDNLIGSKINLETSIVQLTVVGIVQTESPILVLTDENIHVFESLLGTSLASHGSAIGDYTLTSGVEITGPGQILVSDSIGVSLGNSLTLLGKTFEVVGLYTSEKIYRPIISEADYNEIVIQLLLDRQSRTFIYFYSEDVNTTVEEIKGLSYKAIDAYATQKATYLSNQREAIASRLQSIFIILAGVIVYIFFMMRSSMLGRIKEIGIYRSIGASKRDIFKIFFSEIIAFTTIGSLTGYLFMTYMITQVQKALEGFTSIFYFPLYLFVSGIVVIYLVNIVFGMLPIFSLLRKTPSEINAKYDI